MTTQEPRASEIDVQTYEPEVLCGRFCYGGTVEMKETSLPQHTDVSDVWVSGSDYLAIAARLKALEEALRWYATNCANVDLENFEGMVARQEVARDAGNRARAILDTVRAGESND